MPKGFQLWPEAWQERFGHYVEPVAAYFPAIGHAKPSWSLAVVSVLVALIGAGLAWRYYFKGVQQRSEAAGQQLTEIDDGPVSRGGLPRAVHTALVNKYYFDHLYTDVIVKAVKGPLAKATYWSNQRVIDGVVNEAGRQSVAAGRAVYDHIDQTLIDRVIVDGSGRASDGAGEEPERHADRQGPAVRRHPVRGGDHPRRRVHAHPVAVTPQNAIPQYPGASRTQL